MLVYHSFMYFLGLILFIVGFSGCANYPRKLDPALEVKKPSIYSASLNFIRDDSSAKESFQYRDDTNREQTAMFAMIEKSTLFKNIETRFENFLSPQDLVIDITYSVQMESRDRNSWKGGLLFFWALLPISDTETSIVKWTVTNSKGLNKVYSSKVEIPKYYFILGWPVAIAREIEYKGGLQYGVRLATEDILSQIDRDIASGNL